MMKEQYYNNIMKKVRSELKLDSVNAILSLKVSETGEKITVDGIEYFDSIKAVDVTSHNISIATYNIETKKLRYYTNISNIVVVNDLVKFLNNYNGCEIYKLTKKAQNKLMLLEKSKDDIDVSCVLSDYEIADIMNI